MSFWPLPKSLVEVLVASARPGPLVELGCGEGHFRQRLDSVGVRSIGLDRQVPSAVAHPFVIADARRLPFAAGAVGGFVLANTLRHFTPSSRRQVAVDSYAAARAGGTAVVLEDDPVATSRAEENYRHALQLLARFDVGRGITVSREEIRRDWREPWGDPVGCGEAENHQPLVDADAPLRWMRARQPRGSLGRDLDALTASVETSGMAYGRFWYCVFAKGVSPA